jgi:cell division protein FtsB
MQLEDELERLKMEVKFKNAEIKRLTREYIIKKAESDAFSEELSELEASFAAHLHPSQAIHN